MIYNLTPNGLVVFLNRLYGYIISKETAEKILKQCEVEYDEIFNEEQLIEIVEIYL